VNQIANTKNCVRKATLVWLKGYLDGSVKAALLAKSRMRRASTLENSSFNVVNSWFVGFQRIYGVQLRYLYILRAYVYPSNNTCSDHRRVDSLSPSTEDMSESFDCDQFLAEWWLFRHDGLMMYTVCFCQVLVWLRAVYLSGCYFIPTWLGIQHKLTCLPMLVSWV